MPQVTIHHGINYWSGDNGKPEETMAWLMGDKWAPADAYRTMYTYTAPSNDLNDIFRANNAVDGTEVNVQHQTRSLSVGDIIQIGDQCHAVMPIGFATVDRTIITSRIII